MEKSLVLIKPDGVKRNIIGKIISIYEENGLSILRIKTVEPDKAKAEEHYKEHAEKPFYQSLLDSILDGNIVAMIVSGEGAICKIRDLNGATDPKKALPGTVRNLYALDIQQNTVHASDSEASAEKEISIWFPEVQE